MRRFVALSTSCTPAYVLYAPVVMHLWRTIGFEPRLIIRPGDPTWRSALGIAVRSVPSMAEGIVELADGVAPLSEPNLMRASRLALCALPDISDDDQILTSDIDMFPLLPAWFRRERDIFVLRADAYINFESRVAAGHRRISVGDARFPMCYVGMKAAIWRQLIKPVEGDLVATIKSFGFVRDDPGADETVLSARLVSALAEGDFVHLPDQTAWQQGQLWMEVGRHCWRHRDGYPLRMVTGGAETSIADPIDMHAPRVYQPWIAEVAARHYPTEAAWIRQTFATLLEAAR